MSLRHTLLPLIATLAASLAATVATAANAAAAAAPQVFEAELNGVRAELRLVIAGGAVEGSLHEGASSLALRGTADGPALQGWMLDPASGLQVMRFDARIDGAGLALTMRHPAMPEPARVLMHRAGTPRPVAAAPAAAEAPQGAAVDARLVGRWQQQRITSSDGGTGFASFTTLRTLELGADGQVREWLKSVGGGAGWSHRSEPELQFAGHWAVRGDRLWLQPQGQPGFVEAGRVQLVDGRMVIENGRQRAVWQR